MATATTQLTSADEFFEFVNRPENRDRHFELDEGEIVEIPLTGERQSVICANLAGLFYIYTRQIKRGRVLANDAGLILDRDPDTVRGPDIAVFTNPKKYEDLSPRFIDDMPTVVVEVLSPNDSSTVMIRKLNRFLDRGTEIVWLVDPESRTVAIWWKGQAPIVFDDTEEVANLPALPDFRCRVAEIFDRPGEC